MPTLGEVISRTQYPRASCWRGTSAPWDKVIFMKVYGPRAAAVASLLATQSYLGCTWTDSTVAIPVERVSVEIQFVPPTEAQPRMTMVAAIDSEDYPIGSVFRVVASVTEPYIGRVVMKISGGRLIVLIDPNDDDSATSVGHTFGRCNNVVERVQFVEVDHA